MVKTNDSHQPKLSIFWAKIMKKGPYCLLSYFEHYIIVKKMEIIVVLSKTELQLDINRSPSIVVKTIKICAFLRSSKKSMSALP
jgi:hypothetical protein